nr:MerR family DNA-binding protein [uncultured Ruegeria sp.]
METICYYEREGIVSKPARAQNNRRLYSASGVGRLRFLKKCHDLDLPLSDAKTLWELSEESTEDCRSVKELAEVHIASVRNKIDELRRLEQALSGLTASCDCGNVHCPMLQRLTMMEDI